MRQRRTITVVPLRPISIVDALTRSFIRLSDPDAADLPVGFSIPIPPGSNGLSVLYYTRKLTGNYDRYAVYLDGQAGIAGGLNSQDAYGSGVFHPSLFVDGSSFYYGPRAFYSFRRWTLIALNTAPGLSYGAGALYFNLYAGSTSRLDGLETVDYANVLVYNRAVTDAEKAAPVPPGDYVQHYTFDGLQPGDVTVAELLGTGLDGTLYYA